jgi:S1-C subfamily serine protease
VRKLVLVTFLSLFSIAVQCFAQDAVPTEILLRTQFIKGPSEEGTAFTVDYKGKVYIVTARHVVAGVPMQNATIQEWRDGEWKDYRTVKTIYPSSSDVDIAIFETTETVDKPFSISAYSDTGATFGQQVWFLGYPFGIFTHGATGDNTSLVAPFIKRGTMSAIDATNRDAVVLYIDGFNNPGFSGGPIVFWDFTKRTYEILGVVQGYREDAAKVLINGRHVDTQILVNTGILVAYDIRPAMKAIEASNEEKK